MTGTPIAVTTSERLKLSITYNSGGAALKSSTRRGLHRHKTTSAPLHLYLLVFSRIETSAHPDAKAASLITCITYITTCMVIDDLRDKYMQNRHDMGDGEACHRIKIAGEC